MREAACIDCPRVPLLRPVIDRVKSAAEPRHSVTADESYVQKRIRLLIEFGAQLRSQKREPG